MAIFGLNGLVLFPGFIAGRAGFNAGFILLPGLGLGIGFIALPGLPAGRGLILGLAGRGIGFTARFGLDTGFDILGLGTGLILGLVTAFRGGGGFICPCFNEGGAAFAVSIKEKQTDALRKKATVIMLIPHFIFLSNMFLPSLLNIFLYYVFFYNNATSFYRHKKTVR